MHRKIIAALVIAIFAITARAQESLERILTLVEQNNTTLQAFRKEVDAQKMGNRTGIFPDNPTAEVYFLRENNEPGRRTDFQVAQSFDFPTVYGQRSRLANARNNQLESRYQEFRKDVFLRAHELYIDMVYVNALGHELQIRLDHASSILKAYETMFDAGQTNLLEVNKARINHINASQALARQQIEKETTLAALAALNGGNRIAVDNKDFGMAQLPPDFNQWFSQVSSASPSLSWYNQQIEISRAAERLALSETLPKFSAGFMRESLPGETFQGFGMGISIPLWENRNTVKYSKLRTISAQSQKDDALLNIETRLRSLYNQASGLNTAAIGYSRVLQELNNSHLLRNALEAGQISLIEYLMELSFYYEAVNNSLETQRNLHKTLAAMRHFTR